MSRGCRGRIRSNRSQAVNDRGQTGRDGTPRGSGGQPGEVSSRGHTVSGRAQDRFFAAVPGHQGRHRRGCRAHEAVQGEIYRVARGGRSGLRFMGQTSDAGDGQGRQAGHGRRWKAQNERPRAGQLPGGPGTHDSRLRPGLYGHEGGRQAAYFHSVAAWVRRPGNAGPGNGSSRNSREVGPGV